MRQFFGKYRGTVKQNVDPYGRGRVQVSVPSVLGEGGNSWAEPGAPYAGDHVGWYSVPPVGASVWVEFEAGDPRYPILAGAFWQDRQAPTDLGPSVKVWKSDAVTITLNDLPGVGGLTIEVGAPAVATPMKLSMTGTGITLSIGKSSIVLDPASVSINETALVVT